MTSISIVIFQIKDVLMLFISLNDIAISNINGADQRCIINGISKSNAVNLIQNPNLSEKQGLLQRQNKYKKLLPHLGWVKNSNIWQYRS